MAERETGEVAEARRAYREALGRFGDEPSNENRLQWRLAQRRLADLVSRHGQRFT